MRTGLWRGKRWLRWTLGAALAALVLLAVLIAVAVHRAEPVLRARIVAELERHFHARVELDSFHVSLAGGLWAEGKGLRIWPAQAQPDGTGAGAAGAGAPLIRLEEFRFHAPLRLRPGQPIRISVVELKGLTVDVPPRPHFLHASAGGAEQAQAGAGLLRFTVDNIVCSGARLTIETGKPAAAGKPGKLPLQFAIAHLKLTDVSAGGAMGFEAELTNPRPAGTITTAGSFGPWVVEDPGASAVVGSYKFEHADLSVFRGIAGILSSTGRYRGTLRDLTVDGETDTPDFRLTDFGTALPLHTDFHAKVDGTDGDTWLEPVEATLGRSHFWASGKIVRVPGAGHDIALTMNVDRGRVEDFLRLMSRSGAPLLTGALTMKAAVEIPPGPAPVHERLKMNGSFALEDARFTSAKIQDRIDELSERGQGRPQDAKSGDAAGVRSAMQGNFTMAGGVITLPGLKYTVPGAEIDLKGTYGVEGGALDFAGTARMKATISQMVGGWKGLLLKPLDPYFEKGGAGTEVPIRIEGTRENPEFGIDFDRMKSSSPATPGQPR